MIDELQRLEVAMKSDIPVVTQGKSAYELAVEDGFEGTQEQWLESLKAEELTDTLLQQLLNLHGYTVEEKLRVLGANSGVISNAGFHNFLFLFDKRLDNEDSSSPDKVAQRSAELGRMEAEGYSYWKNSSATATSGALPEVPESEIRLYDNGNFQIGSLTNYIEFGEGAVITVVNGETINSYDLSNLSQGSGAAGKSAYQIAVDSGFVGTEAEWLQSLEGVDGKSAYQLAVEDGFVGTQSEWLASLKGTDGQDGQDGVDGKSAYELAVEAGFVGTQAEWLASLESDAVGKSAYQVAVDAGFVGTESQWLDSLKGQSAYQLAVSLGYSGTEAQWLQSLEGTDGADGQSAYQLAVLGGYSGTEAQWLASLDGTDGIDGKSAYELAVLAGYSGTEAEWLASLKVSEFTQYKLAILDSTGPLDLAQAQCFRINASEDRTLSFVNGTLPADRLMTVVLVFTGSAGNITWPVGISWSMDTAPALATNKTYVTLLWDGVSWTGSVGAYY